MIIPKIFSRLVESPEHKAPSEKHKQIRSVLDNLHFNTLKEPFYGIATLKKSPKEVFKHISMLLTNKRGETMTYKLGAIDFPTIKYYSVVRIPHPIPLETDPVVIKIHETYIDYEILRSYIHGKKRVYYVTKGCATVYIQFDKDWWFYISQLRFDNKYYRLIECKKKSDLIESVI